jgi:hypothetical protein
MEQSNKEDKYGFDFPIEDFTQFFFSLDDETLAQIAYTYPQALRNMCVALTIDQQLLREEMEKRRNKKLHS